MRLKASQAAEIRLGRQRAPQHEEGEHLVPYLRSANITDGALLLDDVKTMNFTPAEQAIFELRDGDVLVTEGSGSRDTVGASAVWHAEFSGTVCFQNTLLRMRPRPGITDGRFIAWWARHAHASGQMAAVATGANILHLGADGLRRLELNAPPIDEQRRIAEFLDDQVSRIDAVMAARRGQGALADDAFDRLVLDTIAGRDDSGERRPSGLRWLGPVPSDWPVLAVSSQFETVLGKMLDERQQTGDHPLPYLRNTNVQWDRIETHDLKVMDITPSEYARCTVRAGDLLICEGGQPGRAAIWDGSIELIGFQKALHRARTRGRSNPRWLLHCLRAAVAINAFGGENGVTTIGHLTGEQLREQRFPFPEPEVQRRLIEELDGAMTRRDALKASLVRSTELLAEYKQSLITAAVTGELDVTTSTGRSIPA